MTLARSVRVESGHGGQFWFSTAMVAKDARNVTYKERIKTTPYMRLYGKKKDIAKNRAFGCSAYVYQNEEQRGKGKFPKRLRQSISALNRSQHQWIQAVHSVDTEDHDIQPSAIR